MTGEVVAIYSDTYHPATDGVVTYIDSLRKILIKNNYRPVVVTTSTKPVHGATDVLYTKGVVFKPYPQYDISIRPLSRNREVMELEPFVIHSQTPFSMGMSSLALARKTGVRKVATFHSLVFHEAALSAYMSGNPFIRNRAKKLLIRYLRWHYGKFDTVISPSYFLKRHLLEIGIDNVQVINNGVDLEEFLRAPEKSVARKTLKINSDDKIALYLGRIGLEKNLEILIESLPYLKKFGFKLYIVGGGPYLEYFRGLFDPDCADSIIFTGRVSDELKILYFAAADVFVNPSEFEVLSTVDIESLASGTPILVPADSSQDEIITRGVGGETFEPGKPADMAEIAEHIYQNFSSYNPRKDAMKFSLENHLASLMKVYRGDH